MTAEQISEEMKHVKETEELLDVIAEGIERAPLSMMPEHQKRSVFVRMLLELKADPVYTPELLKKLDKIDAIIERRLNEKSIQ